MSYNNIRGCKCQVRHKQKSVTVTFLQHRPVLFLGGTHTHCGYAARANSDGAKLSFAVVNFLRLQSLAHWLLTHC